MVFLEDDQCRSLSQGRFRVKGADGKKNVVPSGSMLIDALRSPPIVGKSPLAGHLPNKTRKVSYMPSTSTSVTHDVGGYP